MRRLFRMLVVPGAFARRGSSYCTVRLLKMFLRTLKQCPDYERNEIRTAKVLRKKELTITEVINDNDNRS